MARTNLLDDPAVAAVVQKAVAEAVKAEQRRTKEILKDLRAKVKEELSELKEAQPGRESKKQITELAARIDAKFKAAV